MNREAKLFVFLLLIGLIKFIEARVEKKGAEAVPLKDNLTNGDSRGGKFISNHGNFKVFIKTRY